MRHPHRPARPSAFLWVLLAAAGIGGLGGPAPGTARADEDPAAGWRDAAALERHLSAACDAVEEMTGSRFPERPTVTVSTQAEVEAVLAGQRALEQGLGEAPPAETRSFIAYYEPEARRIHVLPDSIAAAARAFETPELLDEDVLRVILVHEATHAMDFQRFPVQWTLACCGAADERLAVEAVLEGHAQLVAEEVSRTWGIESAFQRLTRLYAGGRPAEGGEDVAFDQEAAFTYIQGHAFMRTVRTAGGHAGIEAAIQNPPAESRVIDRPILWLRPELRGEEPDLKAVLEAFRPLLRGTGWTNISKWRVLGPSGSVLLPSTGPGEPDIGEGYIDNHSLYAGSPDGNRYLNVFLAECPSELAAERLVEALAKVDAGRDSDEGWAPPQRQQGAGAGSALEGFVTVRQPLGSATSPQLTLQVVREGTYVIELTVYGVPGATRAAQDEALDIATRLFRARPSTAAAVALRTYVRDFLAARENGRRELAGVLLRDLLATEADVRRVIRPEDVARFLDAQPGPLLPLRSANLPDATVQRAFHDGLSAGRILAFAATTEELIAGTGSADRFPPQMLAFAREHAQPGVTWLVLVLATQAAPQGRLYSVFARLGDRFLFLIDPWRAFGG